MTRELRPTSVPVRSFIARLRERLRYGLLTQELLDRLARFGIVICPYYLVSEGMRTKLDESALRSSITFARLTPEQAPLVAGMPCKRLKLDYVHKQMSTAVCFGVFDGAELIGYSWASFSAVNAPTTQAALFELDARGAYLFDMYIARSHRGERLAPWLRYRSYEQVTGLGRDRIYSVTLAHNNSPRRFKQRLGAVEIEKRLLIGLMSLALWDVRVRALTAEPLPSPRSILSKRSPTGA